MAVPLIALFALFNQLKASGGQLLTAAPQPPAEDACVQPYPGGEDRPAYRWAFNVWIVLILLVICLGFLNYLATILKPMW